LTEGSVLDADTTVVPVVSSITWAEMCVRLRKTASLGRSLVPPIFFRCRSEIRRRRSCFVFTLIAVSTHEMKPAKPFVPF